MSEIRFTIKVPEASDKGYLRFLKRQMQLKQAFDSKDFGLDDFLKIEEFLISCMVIEGDTNPVDVIEDMSLDDFRAVFDQITSALNPDAGKEN